MAIGSSRLATSATGDGAHSTDCEYALDPWPPACPSPASTTVPWGRQASATARHPGPHAEARGARSYGQSEGCTEAVSVMITPAPPAARAS